MPRSRQDTIAVVTLVPVAAWAIVAALSNGNVVIGSVGIGGLAAAFGIWRRASWGYLLGGLFAVLLILLAAFILVFSLGLSIAEGQGLGGPWIGLGFVVLNGYLSIALLVALILAGMAILVATWRGLRAPVPVP